MTFLECAATVFTVVVVPGARIFAIPERAMYWIISWSEFPEILMVSRHVVRLTCCRSGIRVIIRITLFTIASHSVSNAVVGFVRIGGVLKRNLRTKVFAVISVLIEDNMVC